MKEYTYYIVYMYVEDGRYIYGNMLTAIGHKITTRDLSDITFKLSKRHSKECMIIFFSEVG